MAIWVHSAKEWGSARAVVYMADLDAAFAKLAGNPGLGVATSDRKSSVRRWPCGVHHIYYRSDRSTLYVLRILHNRMDAPRHLR